MLILFLCFFFFFFNDTATTEIYTLSLHDALPIYPRRRTGSSVRRAVSRWRTRRRGAGDRAAVRAAHRSEEHTSELQSPCNLVCRLLLEKKKNTYTAYHPTQCADCIRMHCDEHNVP